MPPLDRGPFYFGDAGRERFAFWDPASGAPRGGVLLCNPIGDDAIRAHRPLRHLAGRLSRAGFGVVRFDFHGTGDSSGDEREPDRVKTWLDDVRLAVAELKRRIGDAPVAVVGLRFGATLAAAVAAKIGGVESLVLWGAFAKGSAFATESTRLHKMHKMLEPKSFAGGPRTRPDGEEALGFLITTDTTRDLASIDLMSLAKRPARRALFVSDGSARGEKDLVAHFSSLDVATEHHVIAGCQQFLVEIPHKSRLPEATIGKIVDYLSRHHAAVAGPIVEPAGTTLSGPHGEEPLVIGPRPLFSILHPPAIDRAGLPPILLMSAGTVHRIGPHRMYVGLARRWAKLGFTVLRVDLGGIGDTPAGRDGVENVTYPRDGYDDIDQAIGWLLRRTGSEKVILAGLCSGGDFAFQVGMRDPRAIASIIMNPRTFCVNDLALVEGDGGAPVNGMAASVPASLSSMAARGVDTLLVVTESDPGVHYVDTHCPAEMSALGDVRGFQRVDVPGTDHNFTSLWAQETVSNVVTDHLVRRYPS